MTRAYEVAMILDPSLADSEIERFMHSLRQLFAKQEADIINEDIWGRRPTAYKLKGNSEGYYLFFDVNMPTTKVAALENELKLNETVIRHLIIVKEE